MNAQRTTDVNLKDKQFLRPADIIKIYGVSRVTINNMVKRGVIPPPNRPSPKIIGWSRKVLDAVFLGETA